MLMNFGYRAHLEYKKETMVIASNVYAHSAHVIQGPLARLSRVWSLPRDPFPAHLCNVPPHDLSSSTSTFFSASNPASSPFWCIETRISHPPTNSPPR